MVTFAAFLLGAACAALALLALWFTRREQIVGALDRATWRARLAWMGVRLWWQRVRPW